MNKWVINTIGILSCTILVSLVWPQDSSKVSTDTTLSKTVTIEHLTQQYNNLVAQKKQIEDQILRLEGQISLLQAMTSDSLKLKK